MYEKGLQEASLVIVNRFVWIFLVTRYISLSYRFVSNGNVEKRNRGLYYL